MKKALTSVVLFAFLASPAGFAAPLTPEEIYRDTYVSAMQDKDPSVVLNTLLTESQANHVTVKEALQAAVAKGWIDQDQLNTVLSIAKKYSYLAQDQDLAAKAKAGAISQKDLATLSQIMQGDITGATYWCNYYGCYYNRYGVANGVGITLAVVLVVALVLTPVLVIYN